MSFDLERISVATDDNFPIAYVSDVCSVGDGAHSKVGRVTDGIPYLTSKNIGIGALKLEKFDCITLEDFERLFPKKSKATRRPMPGDLLIGIIGTFGNAYLYAKKDYFGVASSVGILRPDPAKLHPKFLYYVITSPKFRSVHVNHDAGSAQGYTNIAAVKRLQVPLPPLAHQYKISKLLGLLDDRIALSRETACTAESISKALLKSWIIDFDPVVTKSEGGVPLGIGERTAQLFPDGLEHSELGKIPRGWRVVKLREVLDALNERVGSLSVPEYSSTNSGLVPRSDLYQKQLAASQSKNKIVRKGDLIFGLSRQVLNFGQMDDDIGSVSSAYKVYRIDGAVIRPELLGRLIRARESYFFNAVSASSREGQSVSSDALGMLSVVVPPESIQSLLMGYIEALSAQSRAHRERARTLSEIRDTLLPRLISGRLRISEGLSTER